MKEYKHHFPFCIGPRRQAWTLTRRAPPTPTLLQHPEEEPSNLGSVAGPAVSFRVHQRHRVSHEQLCVGERRLGNEG